MLNYYPCDVDKHVHTRTHARTHTAHTHTHTHARTHTHTHAHTHARTHARTHAHTRARTHTPSRVSGFPVYTRLTVHVITSRRTVPWRGWPYSQHRVRCASQGAYRQDARARGQDACENILHSWEWRSRQMIIIGGASLSELVSRACRLSYVLIINNCVVTREMVQNCFGSLSAVSKDTGTVEI